jgi:hypothetical protein
MNVKQIDSNKWVATVMKNGKEEDLYIQFDEAMINQVGWEPGDVIEWFDNEDGTYTLRKKDE